MSEDRLTILAVDDEHTQLEDLARLLRASPYVEEVECALDGHDALVKVSTSPYDVIYLDVRMPDLDGLELARVLKRFASPPELVFVSAYDTAAVDAFELRALDYLRKPVSRRRVDESIERVVATLDAATKSSDNGHGRLQARVPTENDMVAVASVRSGAIRLIARSTILYTQSNGDFVRIVTDDGRFLLRATLAEIEHRWEPFGFVRVHRQYVANLTRAVELRPRLGGTAELAFPDGQAVPIARRHVPDLSRRLGL
jgi:two-component system, LytTR family, response regulator